MAHRFRHLIRDAGGNGAVNLLESLCDEAARFGGGKLRRVEAPGIIDHAGSVKKGRVVKIGLVWRVCESQEVVTIQIAQSGVKREI